MNELKQCPFCGGDAEKRYIKRKKLFASLRFPYNTHYMSLDEGSTKEKDINK